MKYGLLCAVMLCTGCGGASTANLFSNWDAGPEAEAAPPELVCAPNFCGTIVDKTTGATADCGQCTGNTVCGDNGIANVCGAQCVPWTSDEQSDSGPYDVSPACTEALGPTWWVGYASGGVQLSAACSYTNPNNCVEIENPWPANGECSGSVCGIFWCCLNDPDAGIDPLLPGAVADGGTGLP